MTELSIVILCYRSEEAIIGFAQKMKQVAESLTDSFEIILVGNYIEGSDDRTKEVVSQIAANDSCFKAICKPKKGMMGWDMKEGMKATTGRYICVIDGDGQFPIESVAGSFNAIRKGGYDLVKTYRKKRNDGFYRRLISTVYNFIFSILFPGVNSKDINSKPKILTREFYERIDLQSDDWFIDAEIMINAGRMKANCYEFPIEFYELDGRQSFVKFKAILEFIKNLFIFRFRR